jgi:hypothetical protein
MIEEQRTPGKARFSASWCSSAARERCWGMLGPAGGHGLPCDGPRRRGHAGSSTGGSGFCGEIATARETPGEGAREERREVGKMEPALVRVEAA